MYIKFKYCKKIKRIYNTLNKFTKTCTSNSNIVKKTLKKKQFLILKNELKENLADWKQILYDFSESNLVEKNSFNL